MSVKLAMIAVFLKLDLDYLCASCTAPYHSYRNPAERVLLILNLGLQLVGQQRRIEDDIEEEISICKPL